MKTILLSLFLTFCLATVFAQQKPTMSSMTAEQKADEIVAKLNTNVNLTQDQLPKVKAISLERVNKNTAAFKKIGPNDKARLLATNKSILAEWEVQLKGILSEDQYNKYLQTK